MEGSEARFSAHYGAMLVNATSTRIQFQFITCTGTLIDSYSRELSPKPGASGEARHSLYRSPRLHR